MTRDKKDCYWPRRENDSSWPKNFRFSVFAENFRLSVLLKIFRFSVLLKCWKFFGNRKIFGFFGLRQDEWRRIDAETGFSPSFSVLPNRCWTESVPLRQSILTLLTRSFASLRSAILSKILIQFLFVFRDPFAFVSLSGGNAENIPAQGETNRARDYPRHSRLHEQTRPGRPSCWARQNTEDARQRAAQKRQKTRCSRRRFDETRVSLLLSRADCSEPFFSNSALKFKFISNFMNL